jgi:hypothetical protein
MNASDLTFGVEFEVCIPSMLQIEMGGYHRGVQVSALPEGWQSQSDGSIHPPSGYKGIEIVSPILKGADGIRQVIKVCEWLQSVGARVNYSTGFHVHVGFDRTNEPALKRLVATVANHEQGIYAITGTKSREQGSYCRSVLRSDEVKSIYKNGLGGYCNRYHVLNLANLINGRPTVEFRAFSGTINPTKAIGFIQIAIGFVERAVKDTCPRCFGRKLPKSIVDGQSAAKRMMSFLAWDKATSYGAIADNVELAPTKKEIRKEMMRLAAKYDDSSSS